MDDRYKDLVAGVVVVGIFALVRLVAPSWNMVLAFTTLFAILFHAYVIGRRVFPQSGSFASTAYGTILFFGLQSLIQTSFFYADVSLGSTTDLWSGLGAMLSILVATAMLPHEQTETQTDPRTHSASRIREIGFAAALLFCSLVSVGFVVLSSFRAGTLDSIRTPWPLLPVGTFAAIALAWGAVAVSVWLVRRPGLHALQTGLALFATTAIAPFVYRLGFGFDGFLHVATEKIILSTGTLAPKPMYYIGQYVFTTWLSRTTDLPIEIVDRWLVPVALALILPLTLLVLHTKRESLNPFVLFLLPLTPFVATTPQAFSYTLGLAALFLAARRSTLPALVLACWSLATHPLAGLPILCVVLAVLCARWMFAWIFVLASAVAVPLVFFVLSAKSGTAINWNIANAFTFQPWITFAHTLTPWIGNRFVVWPAWTSLVSQSIPFLLLAAAVASVISERRTQDDGRRTLPVLLASAVLLFVASAFLGTAGEFAFLIDYERGNYAERLTFIGILCLLPAAYPAVQTLCDRARRAQPLLGVAFIGGCLAIATANTANALPRHDALVVGRGWSVGQADVAAVRAIDRNANGQAYTVLANQSVSAAAVSEFGFKRYANDVFFYPIPTGGPLYETYLTMTYREPTLETVQDAAELGGTRLVYVVLNDYWWNADAVAERISRIANDEWTFGDSAKGPGHATRVYAFDLNNPKKPSTDDSGS